MDIKELQEIIQKMSVLRERIDVLTEETKQHNKELSKLKAETVEHLDAHEMRRFDGATHMVYITEKRSLKIEDKFEFFEYLKARDQFEDLATVPSASLGSIYTEAFEAAKEEGDSSFLRKGIPGLSQPSTHRSITFKKITKGAK